MSNSGTINELHPAAQRIALAFLKGVKDFQFAAVNHLAGAKGFDEDQGVMTVGRTSYDSDDYTEAIELYDAICYSFYHYVSKPCMTDVWDHVVNRKKFKDLEFPQSAIKEEINKWCYGFAITYKNGWLRFLSVDQEEIKEIVPMYDENRYIEAQARIESKSKRRR